VLTIITPIVLDIISGFDKKRTRWADYMLDGSAVILVEYGKPIEDRLKQSGITLDDTPVSARIIQRIDIACKIKFAILEKMVIFQLLAVTLIISVNCQQRKNILRGLQKDFPFKYVSRLRLPYKPMLLVL